MRYATTPRWTYVMLIVMGIGFVAGAGAFFAFVPQPTGAIVGTVWVLMGAGMAFFSYRALAKRGADERIARSGTPATATLLSASTTGWVINNVPQWALRLRIDGYGAPYETTLKLQTYSPPSSGATFPVRIDPLRRDHVVLAGDDAGGADAPPAAAAVPGAGDSSHVGAQIEASVLAALKQAGLANDGTTSVTNPDGSRTISSTTFSIEGDGAQEAGAPRDAAQTVKLLADLDRMHAAGALDDAEFETIKRRLLGES